MPATKKRPRVGSGGSVADKTAGGWGAQGSPQTMGKASRSMEVLYFQREVLCFELTVLCARLCRTERHPSGRYPVRSAAKKGAKLL